MQSLVLVRAWRTVAMLDIQAMVPALQQQLDQDFLPAWQAHGATPVTVSAVDIDAIPTLDPVCWPVFINRHSSDGGVLGWHDDENTHVFGRVFAGDCMAYGVAWQVTLSHEVLELVADPTINRTATTSDGRICALEVCDPCEDDSQAYPRASQKVSNFVLPSYFNLEPAQNSRYDFGGHLSAPAPALTNGGYISIEDSTGNWTQIDADRANGLKSARALMHGFRRTIRASRP